MIKCSLKLRGIYARSIKRRMLIGIAIISGLLTISAAASAYYSQKVTAGISDSILRLHVVANSDNEEDQKIKREIRDDILVYMKENMKKDTNLKETKEFVKEHMPDIENIAIKKINEKGMDYGVKAYLGNFDFPTKVYGDIALPSGNYQALRVVLGKGTGANWWCVMFPPLCFVDATHGTVPDSVKKDLKKVLTEDEYALITTADKEEDIPIEIKFKVVEFFEDSKIQFTGMIKKIFKN